MSKYAKRGAYHYAEFADKKSIYRAHVLDLIEKVVEFVPVNGDIYEVGCGEGLILSRLSLIGFNCEGCDIDPIAVGFGRAKGNEIREGEAFVEDREWDAVLLCDVLEHVKDFEATIDTVKAMAPIMIVAVPDRKDPHAVRQDTVDAVVSKFMGWELLHASQRHARHLMVFKRIDK